ncbi:MAG TPA: hypothetical protein VNB49_13155 [Candidatus Dormibacteraeota bacterium]|nr:hypothetical protein [Candidatus Dormibacteraeota bacterium]
MTGAFLFVATGLLLIILLILSFLQIRAAGHALGEPREGDGRRDAFPREPYQQELGVRVFGSQDYDFIAKQGSSRLTRLFLEQRTSLALSLLRNVRANATRLIRVHSRAARTSSHLDPLIEARVVADYLFIQLFCQGLALLVWLRGPVNLFRWVGYADEMSKRLYGLTVKIIPAGLTTEENNR